MSMKPAFDVVWPQNYGEPDAEGNRKTKWHNIGTLFVDKDSGKMSLKIEAMPVSGEFDGWCPVFKKKPRGDAVTQAKAAEGGEAADVNIEDLSDQPINLDDIPF